MNRLRRRRPSPRHRGRGSARRREAARGCARVLAEPDAGRRTDTRADAGEHRRLDALAQDGPRPPRHRSAATCIVRDRPACIRGDRCPHPSPRPPSRIERTGDVVDDRRARRRCFLGHTLWRVSISEVGREARSPSMTGRTLYSSSTAMGPHPDGSIHAHVDDVGAVVRHRAPSRPQPPRRRTGPVTEGVGGDVQHAHHERAPPTRARDTARSVRPRPHRSAAADQCHCMRMWVIALPRPRVVAEKAHRRGHRHSARLGCRASSQRCSARAPRTPRGLRACSIAPAIAVVGAPAPAGSSRARRRRARSSITP